MADPEKPNQNQKKPNDNQGSVQLWKSMLVLF